MEAADLLTLLDAHQARRLRVIENLLRGRRTVSTLYWGQRYGLLPLLDVMKTTERGSLDVPGRELVQQGLANWTTDEQPMLRLTSAGEAARVAHPGYHPQTWLSWPQIDVNAARQRLLLAVQVTSEYAHQTKRYYPLATDLPTRKWVRQWFYQARSPELPETLLAALTTVLTQLPATVAQVTTAGLTGYQQPGLTTQQLGTATQLSAWQVYLMHLDAVVAIAAAARTEQHPLASLLGPTWTNPVTRSAQATLAAVQAGGTLDSVAVTRHVKPSTVREHLLEAAIILPVAELPYQRLIPADLRRDLLAALPPALDDWEYAGLPDALQQRADFFTFRLLAIWQDKRGARHGDA